jgi:hypothetical protein
LTTFFILFHPKLEMPIYMKVASLDKLENFHIGGFEVFRSNLENAAKVPEDIHRCQGLSGVWPYFWPRVDHKGVLTWSSGSIALCRLGFRGDDPGWPRIDQC